SLSFVFASFEFRFGGGVGNMISDWLTGALGNFGTAALLLVIGFAYIIWQFNPAFNLPAKSPAQKPEADIPDLEEELENDEEEESSNVANDNNDKGKSPKLIIEEEKPAHEMQLIEKDPVEDEEEVSALTPMTEQEIVNDLYHQHEEKTINDWVVEPAAPVEKPRVPDLDGLQLEIKSVPEEVEESEEGESSAIENLPPYEPTLDLRDYKYPNLNLLEAHGSERIIQDPAELEKNKDQIIATLRNYSIEIQKISATVGPTVTL